MSIRKSARLHDHFADLTDPRRRKVTYPLINIVAIAVCAVICGADDFVAIAEFGEKKREWFANLAGHRVGNRPDRVEPRAIKRRPKPHRLLTKPRAEARLELLAGAST